MVVSRILQKTTLIEQQSSQFENSQSSIVLERFVLIATAFAFPGLDDIIDLMDLYTTE